ncbi:flagellar hook capping FlgD N-terminal domain-containing protein [Adhaeretor mobilis]|uniref:Basal-body rod modification protein FlgD n=1 Tax=Adhaeretor mobilis TaxID=1930276 RepID=A0A517MYV0_9BACT|nr:flagellar hook capping FlgD N-terminal domain-containing protein [Adhaeretor mobilis]QDT00047.1 Basal-body rod modification protein FlgD [Adhaeretor mobilis]
MAQLPNVTSALTGATSDQPFGDNNSLNDLDIDDFLDLMIAELQNQDPLNPLENDELIAQIGQIREVGATDKLTATLDAVLLGQNITSATNLIGADIEALSDDNQRVQGIVDRISVSNSQPKLHIDLNPSADVDEEPGNLEQGAYKYRVVWEEDGQLFGVDPAAQSGGQLLVGEAGGSSALLSNLPRSTSTKQIYRTDRTGTGEYRHVGSLTDVDQATFLDTKADADRGAAILSGTPQLITPQRSYEISLTNISEIRPPQ